MNSAGARSVMSQDMKDLGAGPEDISKKVQGHKANLSNPSMFLIPSAIFTLLSEVGVADEPPWTDTSEASKENSHKVIEEMGGDAAGIHADGEDQPRSKSAANNLEGSRVADK